METSVEPPPLEYHHIQHLRKAFNLLDVKRTGAVDWEGVQKVMRSASINLTEEKAKEVVSRWSDGDTIDFQNFLAFYASCFKGKNPTTEMKDVFSMLDSEHSGEVPIQRVAAVFAGLGRLRKSEVKAMVREAFPNVPDFESWYIGGKLNYHQFVRLMEF